MGLQTTATIIHVSLCYCGLGVESGLILGHMISSSAVRYSLLTQAAYRDGITLSVPTRNPKMIFKVILVGKD